MTEQTIHTNKRNTVAQINVVLEAWPRRKVQCELQHFSSVNELSDVIIQNLTSAFSMGCGGNGYHAHVIVTRITSRITATD